MNNMKTDNVKNEKKLKTKNLSLLAVLSFMAFLVVNCAEDIAVAPAAPSEVMLDGSISYGNITIVFGSAATNDVLTNNINPGTQALSYEISSITRTTDGSTSGISINPTSGRVLVADTTAVGVYTIEVALRIGNGVARDSFSLEVTDSPVPLTGELSYDDVVITNGHGGIVEPSASSSIRGTSLTYSNSVSPATGNADNITVNDTGVVSLPSNLDIGSYTVTVTVSSAVGGSVTNISNSFNVEVVVPLSGNISYTDITTTFGVEATNAGITNITPGTGTLSYELTRITPPTAGITLDPDSGVLTVTRKTEIDNYEVQVTLSSSAGGSITDDLRVTVARPTQAIGGSFSSPVVNDSELVVGSEGTVELDLSDLSNYTGFTIAPTNTSGPTLGQVSINNFGEITVNSQRLGSSVYRVIASGVTAATLTNLVTIRNSYQFNLRTFTTRAEVRDDATLPKANTTSGTSAIWAAGQIPVLGNHTGQIIDGDRSTKFDFGSDDFLTYAYFSRISGNGLEYTADNTLRLGIPNRTDAVGYGVALNPELFISQNYDLIVRANFSRPTSVSTIGRLGFNVELTAGDNTSTTTGISKSVFVDGDLRANTFADYRTSFTYDPANPDVTIRLFFAVSGSTHIDIEAITVVAR